jgi:hypothetical protein
MIRRTNILITLFFVQFASAHHSMAEFDRNNIHELQGVVTKVRWRNPHVELELQVTEADGNEVIWEIEAQDINTMSRRGLYAGLVGVGDHVRVAGNTSSRRNHVINEDGTRMVYELTVTDPSSFSEPVSGSWLMDWRPDMEMQQYDCIPPEYK